MNAKTTLFLFLIAMMMAGGIWLMEERVPTSREVANGDQEAFQVDGVRVDHVEIKSPEKGSLVLAVKDGFWRVTEPYDDVAHPDRVKALVEALTAVTLGERISQDEFEGGNWKVTGLGEAATKIRVFSGADALLEFAVGNVASIEGWAYVSLPKGKDTKRGRDYLAQTPLPGLLKDTAESWRDDKLLRLPVERVRSVRLLNGEGQIEVERARGPDGEWQGWQLVKPLQTRASREQVDGLITALLNMEVVGLSLTDGGMATRSELSKTLTDQPASVGRLNVTVGIEDRVPFEMQLDMTAGPEPGRVTASVSHRKPTFRVQIDQPKWLSCEPNLLRDDFLARVDPEQVKTLSLSSSRFPKVELKHENQSWFLRRMGAWVGANGERVARVFKALNETRIREFTADSAADLSPYGLDSPFLTVQWTQVDEDGVSLHFGQNHDGTAFYVKAGKEPFVYRISAEVLPEFPPDALKWRDLGVLRFSAFALKEIQINVGSAPTVTLKPDITQGSWSGSVAGDDITALLDRSKADLLASKLGRLNAEEWSSALAEGLEALKEPAVAIRITLRDPLVEASPDVVHRLTFAPTQRGMDTAFYYGRLDDEPDVFYMTRDALQDLVRPTFKDSAIPR